MIELRVVSGSGTGRRFHLEAAPVRLGRESGLDVVLADPGVWDVHAEIVTNAEGWMMVRPVGQALVTVNHETVAERRLRNGDVLGIGALQLQFTLRSCPQRPLGTWEFAVWSVIALTSGSALLVMLALGR